MPSGRISGFFLVPIEEFRLDCPRSSFQAIYPDSFSLQASEPARNEEGNDWQQEHGEKTNHHAGLPWPDGQLDKHVALCVQPGNRLLDNIRWAWLGLIFHTFFQPEHGHTWAQLRNHPDANNLTKWQAPAVNIMYMIPAIHAGCSVKLGVAKGWAWKLGA